MSVNHGGLPVMRVGPQTGQRGIMSVLRRLPAAIISGTGFALLLAGSAHAASPAYCALYSREYTAQFATGSHSDAAAASEYRIQEQAYSQCLNMDVEPPFPDTSVYAGASVEDILGGYAYFIDEMGEGDKTPAEFTETSSDIAVTATSAAADENPVDDATAESVQQAAVTGAPGSARWMTWCREHFPNSFDEATGTVQPFEGQRQRCPAPDNG